MVDVHTKLHKFPVFNEFAPIHFKGRFFIGFRNNPAVNATTSTFLYMYIFSIF